MMATAEALAVAFPASDVDYHCHYTPRLAPEWLDAVALINGPVDAETSSG